MSADPRPQDAHRPVRPRDAASLILHRARKGHTEVLMGRRPLSARFMPGVYVFPGGATEPTDRAVRPATDLTVDVTHLLKVTPAQEKN